jgi:predicted amidohydrolase YtcJ
VGCRVGRRRRARHRDADRHTDPDHHQHGDDHPDHDALGHPDAHRDVHADADGDADSDAHPDVFAHADADGDADSDAHPDVFAHADADGDADGDAHPDAFAHADADAHADPDDSADRDLLPVAFCHAVADTDRIQDADPDPHAEPDPDRDGNADGHPHRHGHAHTDTHADADGDAHADKHAHADSDPDADSDPHADVDAHGDPHRDAAALTPGVACPGRQPPRRMAATKVVAIPQESVAMPAAQLAIFGASIRTMDPARPFATAVAIRDGLVVAVGDDATVRAACDARTTTLDGAGLHLTPGLTDSHFHVFMGTDLDVGLDLRDVETLDDLRGRLREEKRRVGPDGWVRGRGLPFEVFQATGIRGDVIADAVDGGLCFLQFFDLHTAVATPAALAYADITGRERFTDNAEVVVDAHGVPTGELKEIVAYRLVLDQIPDFTPAEKYARYVERMKIWNRLGLTAVHNMDGSLADLDLLRTLEGNGDLSIRINLPFWQKPEMSDDEMAAFLPHRDAAGRRWWGGSTKFFIDGVTETGTGWHLEPDAFGENTAPFWPDPVRYTAKVRMFAEAGFQCITHALGDRAVRHTLDAYEAAGAAPGVRHRVEHIETLTDADLPRFARLGVVASMQPLHMAGYRADESDVVGARLGHERMTRAFRTREILDSGAILALGSDWMVAPYEPMLGMAWARLRRTPGQSDLPAIAPHQRLTGEETLAGYTTMAARAVSKEHVAGMIREGYWADISGFDHDLVTTDPDALLQVQCRLTIVDGEIVHQAG